MKKRIVLLREWKLVIVIKEKYHLSDEEAKAALEAFESRNGSASGKVGIF